MRVKTPTGRQRRQATTVFHAAGAPPKSPIQITPAVRCGAMRCDAVRCGALRCAAVRCGALRCAAVRCGALRCAAVRCCALRCAAVRCGALRCCGLLCCFGACCICLVVAFAAHGGSWPLIVPAATPLAWH